eukprot:6181657-Pleurochrysis_carterae.AAC.1
MTLCVSYHFFGAVTLSTALPIPNTSGRAGGRSSPYGTLRGTPVKKRVGSYADSHPTSPPSALTEPDKPSRRSSAAQYSMQLCGTRHTATNYAVAPSPS